MTAASVVKTLAPRKQNAAKPEEHTAAVKRPNCKRIMAIFRAFALTGLMMCSGMKAWPACTKGSPQRTVKEKRVAAILCAAETVTPSALAARICVV